MTFTLHALWSCPWWTLGTMLTTVSGVANANGETTPQVLRLCASFGSCHENQHANENRKFSSDNDRFWWRNCVHKRSPNRSPFAFRNSFTMLLQIPKSIRSGNTLLTPCTLELRKRLDIVDSSSQHGSTMNVARQQLRRTTHTRPHWSQLQLELISRSIAGRGAKSDDCSAGWSMNF